MAALSGMTGFGRADGAAEWGRWTLEAKSVNGKGLDIRVNLPGGFDAVERAIRQALTRRFKRGSVQVAVRIDATDASGAVVNEALLDTLTEVWLARTGEHMIRAEALATLMAVRGVVEADSVDLRSLGADEAVIAALLVGADDAVAALEQARLSEGSSLLALLSANLDEIEAEIRAAAGAASEQPAAMKSKLETRIAELLGGSEVDPDRVATEVAIMAAKADVREELDRLAAHVATGREHLAAGSPVGRKLDFLAQELSREANTLCSKSASLALTNAGLALKGLIDQFKEQAANVE